MSGDRRSAEYSALSRSERQDIRASQRTFEGAYLRTAISKLTFGLLILRIFSKEFLPLGIVYLISAIFTMGVAIYQRETEKELIMHPSTTFVTGGNIVAATAAIDFGSFLALLVLIAKF